MLVSHNEQNNKEIQNNLATTYQSQEQHQLRQNPTMKKKKITITTSEHRAEFRRARFTSSKPRSTHIIDFFHFFHDVVGDSCFREQYLEA